MKFRITISKYHSWYLCQISLQIMLLPIQISELRLKMEYLKLWGPFLGNSLLPKWSYDAGRVMRLNTSTTQRDRTQCSGQLTKLFCGLMYYFLQSHTSFCCLWAVCTYLLVLNICLYLNRPCFNLAKSVIIVSLCNDRLKTYCHISQFLFLVFKTAYDRWGHNGTSVYIGQFWWIK